METSCERCGLYQCDCPTECAQCGYEEDSFACKIRHLQINTGAAKAADDA